MQQRDPSRSPQARGSAARKSGRRPRRTRFTVPYGDIAAAAVVLTVPVTVLVLLFQRRIAAGLTAGAVKG